jgi:hypothetical protein
MKKNFPYSTCAEFQSQLPELISSWEKIGAHPHLEDCENCRALLADLDAIAAAARQLFPVAEPPDELWDHIQSAITGGHPQQFTNSNGAARGR